MTDTAFSPRDPELIAARFATQRPGYRLVTFAEVGLPVFWLKVRSLVLSPSPLPATQAFLLRTIDAGLTTPEDLAGFLGVEATVVQSDLSELLRRDDLALTPLAGEAQQSLRLTPKGSVTMAREASEFPEERTLWFGVDATTGRVVIETTTFLLSSRDARSEGLRPFPTLRTRPETSDLGRAEVQQAFEKATGRRVREQTILSFLDIEERHTRYTPAVALVFRGAGDDDVQVAFAVEGHVSTAHEEAFAKLEGAARAGLLRELKESGKEVSPLPTGFPGDGVVYDTPLSDDLEKTAADAVLSRAEERDAADALRESTTDQERRAEEQRRSDARQRAKAAEDRLATPTIRRLSVFEHAPLLKSALATSSERLLLISPWITAKVVDGAFIDEFHSMLERRVKVYLGYGLEDGKHTKEPTDQDKAAIQELERMAKRFPHFTFRKFGNIHSKILIVDRTLAVYTSFNWLSFRGDPRRPLREENGLLVTIPEKVDQFFAQELARFAVQ